MDIVKKIMFLKKLPVYALVVILLVSGIVVYLGVFPVLAPLLPLAPWILGAAVLLYVLNKAFMEPEQKKSAESEAEINKRDKQIEELIDRLEKKEKEIEAMRHRAININEIHQVLQLNLYEYDFDYTRAYEKYLQEKDGCMLKFVGGLQVNGRASYGVDFKDVKMRLTGPDTVEIYMPTRLNSIQINDSKWLFSHLLAFATMNGSKMKKKNVDGEVNFSIGDLLGGIFKSDDEAYWVDNDFYPNTKIQLMEDLRREAEKEVQHQNATEILQKKIQEQSLILLKQLLQISDKKKLILSDKPGIGSLSLDEFVQKMNEAKAKQLSNINNTENV